MNLESVIAFSSAWASAMLRACWQGGLLILVVWLLCRLSPRLPDTVRCGLWWLACVKLILGLIWATPISLAALPPASAPVQAVVGQSANSGKSSGLAARQAHGLPGHPSSQAHPTSLQSREKALSETILYSSELNGMKLLIAACFCLWLAGVGVRLGLLARQFRAFRRLIAGACPLEEASVYEQAKEIAAHLGLKRLPRLLVTETGADTFACGLLRPTVLLPQADLHNLSATELRLVLAHELAHLRRGDLWLSLLPMLAQNLFFFFPPAWVVCREFEIAREAACDAVALRATQTPAADYGQLLLKLGARESDLNRLYPASALGVSSQFRVLQSRLVRLQNATHLSRRSLIVGCGLLFANGLLGLIPWRLVAAPLHSQDKTNPMEETYNAGSGTEWKNAPMQPQNLDFERGLEGWKKIEAVGNSPDDPQSKDYQAGVEPNSGHDGKAAAFLTNVVAHSERGGLLKQGFRANEYRGKRLRLSAYLKTEQVSESATLWIRQDTPDWQRAWNSLDRPITGTHDWQRVEYVFDVAPNSQGLDFGIALSGTGKLLISGVQFEVVGNNVPTTEPDYASLSATPRNMDFSQGIRSWHESTHDGEEAYFASGLDPDTKRHGLPMPYLACNVDKKGVYGVLTQWLDAKPYRGKRVRFSGDVKTRGVREFAGLMLGFEGGKKMPFYDTRKHPLHGDTDWTHYEIVADVTTDQASMVLGINLQGRGMVWMSDLKFEVVGKDVPLTPPSLIEKEDQDSSSLPAAPANLDFQQGLKHWGKTANGGETPNPYYEVGIDRTVQRNGIAAAYLKASVPQPQGYGVLRQDFSAKAYRGKRVRLSAYLKTKDMEDYTGLMVSASTRSDNKTWAMSKRPIKGTTDWTRYEYVVDVEPDWEMFMIGVSIKGRGQVWASGFSFEVVGKEVPVTTDSPEVYN